MLCIQISNGETLAVARIPAAHAASFRSAVTEMRNELGERSSGAHHFDKEDALTRAMNALGAFAAALNQVVPEEDSHYA